MDIDLIQNLHLDLSDFIDAEIAVVDAIGAIVHCNRKWDETARIGQLSPKLPGWNYIADRCAPARSSQVRARLLNRSSGKAGIRICERRRCAISG